jgi:hypothetical protein
MDLIDYLSLSQWAERRRCARHWQRQPTPLTWICKVFRARPESGAVINGGQQKVAGQDHVHHRPDRVEAVERTDGPAHFEFAPRQRLAQDGQAEKEWPGRGREIITA